MTRYKPQYQRVNSNKAYHNSRKSHKRLLLIKTKLKQTNFSESVGESCLFHGVPFHQGIDSQ